MVVGAGVTGLAAGFGLSREGHDVVVLEATDRVGGHIRTEHVDGFTVECGPESVRGGPPEVAELLDELGLHDAVVTASPASKHRYLLHQGRLEALPGGPGEAFRTPLFRRRAVVRALLEPFVPPDHRPEETVYRFLRRRLGRRMAETVADPLMAGIYGGDPHHLEAATCLSRFVAWEEEHGGLFRGGFANRGSSREPKGSFTFTHGVQQLVDTLADRLGDAVRRSEPATALHPSDDGVRVETGRGDLIEADAVVVTCDPQAARALLPELPIPAAPRAPVAAVHLGYRATDVPGGLPGFGWLVHSRERSDVLGCLWVSGTFPLHAPPAHHVVRLMVGGTRAPELAHLGDDALVAHVRRVLREVQGVTATPLMTHIARALPGIPQYPPGFAGDLEHLREAAGPRVRFAGWFYGGIGIADGIVAARGLRTITTG